jgi:uncharacterized membrane protein
MTFLDIMYIVALLIGIIAGLRTFTAPAAVAWAAHLGWLPVAHTSLAFMDATVTSYIFTILAIVELVLDQLPSTPSRKVPMQFGARLISGALCGATVGAAAGSLIGGLILGLIGAVIGTLAGYEARKRLAKNFGGDLPAALIEDLVAIVGAILIVAAAA